MLRKREQGIEDLRRHGQWSDVWKRLMDNKLAMVGLGIIVVLILVAIFSKWIAPYDYAAQNIREKFQFPNGQHWLGTDNYGRDIFSRIIVGARISLLVSLLALVISLVIGGALGCVAGYFGGKVDTIIMRLMDILMAVPALLLAVSISTALGTGVFNTALAIAVAGILGGGLVSAMIALGITMWTGFARLARSHSLALKNVPYVQAARLAGKRGPVIMIAHILPNIIGPILTNALTQIGTTMIGISGLSFLGLGVVPPTAEWGSMINESRAYIQIAPWAVLYPALATIVTIIVFNYLGDCVMEYRNED